MKRIIPILAILLFLGGCRQLGLIDYWEENGIDYSDVDAARDRFAEFAELACASDPEEASAALDILFDKLKDDEVAYYLYTDWMGSAFYNPLSPCRNPELYAKAAERVASDGILSQGESFIFTKRSEWSRNNMKGTPAVVPGVRLDGRRTLVLIIDLSCPSCIEALQRMADDPEWADARRVALCCGFGPLPEVEGWEYTVVEDPADTFDPELTPVYFVVSGDSTVEKSYAFANQDGGTLPQEVKDGDVVLVTNEKVEKFLTEVDYPENDYSFTSVLNEDYGPNAPGDSDRPRAFTIRWQPKAKAGVAPTVRLWEDDGWSREYTDLAAGDNYLVITNLRPNANYHFVVKAGKRTLTSGSFQTTGHLHQLFFDREVRNVRDLGGWKTKDGRTVKYRMIYRGGRLEDETVSEEGKKEILAEGIRAQLDLRGVRDVLSVSPMGEDFEFCAPVLEEGYRILLRDDSEKARQCFEFVLKCVREGKPVYYNCSLGRDRTGTFTMMLLGILGVDEGDISKEYELTLFAPHGWATSGGETVKMTRTVGYQEASSYIWDFAGENGSFADGMQAYLLSIGVSQKDIDDFRSLMLE